MERIFLRDVGTFKAGEIRELDWHSFQTSLLQFHNIRSPLETYSMPVEEAARRYVESLQSDKEAPRVTAKAR